jgi:DNA-directed RNA polymerase subunit M
MYPKGNVFVCFKCGFEKKKTGTNLVVAKQTKKEVAIFEEKINVLPKTKVKCPKCGHNEAFWILRQMRGSDEPETRFFTCTKCEYKWREN